MTSSVAETIRVRHAASDIFALVSDVERYPEFVPYITNLRIIGRSSDEDNDRHFIAEALVRYKIARERFVTRVDADPQTLEINVNLVKGPFRTLDNCWRLTPLADGSTQIDFSIKFEFANMVLGMLLNANKDRAVRTLIRHFVEEADRRYPTIGEQEFGDLRTVYTE
ncbi:type II toxin-antitoxin system RatA family toxin [Hyphobacterium sp.]|uniref:type II toxin-antitoxin system RatA family toxin n=1 Tax=Hyphobacterium sp. TaxID=2004662 RepID=UPI003B528D28